ncbi:MAG: PH domain-containing protein [Hoylesella buccalis]
MPVARAIRRSGFYISKRRAAVRTDQQAHYRQKGIVERNSLELMLRKCEGVQIKQTMLGRIFNYGTVYVTTGEATNSFEYIQDPIVFSTKIHQMIDALKASE